MLIYLPPGYQMDSAGNVYYDGPRMMLNAPVGMKAAATPQTLTTPTLKWVVEWSRPEEAIDVNLSPGRE